MPQTSARPHIRLVAAPEPWSFTMLNPEQQRAVLQAINRCPKPATTLRVWNAVISCLRYDTGEVAASSETLAGYAEVPPHEARRALGELVRLGALLRPARGRYKVNAHIAWSGSLQQRAATAAATRPVLRLVEPTPAAELHNFEPA